MCQHVPECTHSYETTRGAVKATFTPDPKDTLKAAYKALMDGETVKARAYAEQAERQARERYSLGPVRRMLQERPE